VDSVSAKSVWLKMSGGCHVMESPGNAPIAADKMGSAINSQWKDNAKNVAFG
jgi:hypothetical protein